MPESPLSRAGDRAFTIFEAVNNDLKEIYVTAPARPIFDAMADLGKRLPSAISHWRPDKQQINFRSLEFNQSREKAASFIERHTAKPCGPQWGDTSFRRSRLGSPSSALATLGAGSKQALSAQDLFGLSD